MRKTIDLALVIVGAAVWECRRVARKIRVERFLLHLICVSTLLAQAGPAPQGANQPARPVGVVTAIDTSGKTITIKTDAGTSLSILFGESTRFVKISPGATDLKNAAVITSSDVAVGDRILAQGQSSSAPGSFSANTIILMSQSEIAKKQAAERADWQRRGVGGTITALNPVSAKITIRARTQGGSMPMVITLAPGAALRRYTPDSIRFSDAKPSRFEELRIGDQVRVLGTGSEDHARLVAEEIVSGTFRTIAGTVLAVDAGQNNMQIADLSSNKKIQIRVTSDSTVRRLSTDAAKMLAAQLSSKGTTVDNTESAAPNRPTQNSQSVQSIIERLPPLSLADIKPGEAVIVAGISDQDSLRMTALTLLAGAEPVLKASPKGGKEGGLGSWDLDLDMSPDLP